MLPARIRGTKAAMSHAPRPARTSIGGRAGHSLPAVHARQRAPTIGARYRFGSLLRGGMVLRAMRVVRVAAALIVLVAALGWKSAAAQTFSRLQVLLPGETAAPGTPTGKTGTAAKQTAGVPFNVTVRATDANFNLVAT